MFLLFVQICVRPEMLLMCVLYVSFWAKVILRTFGCAETGSAVLFILRSRLLVYSACLVVKRVQVVLSGFSVRWLCLPRQKLYVGMVVCISFLHS